jgi:trehalose utilization protein
MIWNENVHETTRCEIAAIYPDGIHGVIGAGLSALLGDRIAIRYAAFADDEHGLSEEVSAGTDVLVWWGHKAHDTVRGYVVERIRGHVLAGMGLIVLHSAHFSRIFSELMGTTCSLAWRNEGELELVWTVDPTHPIADGVPSPLRIEQQEMYGEFFDIPAPDELIFISSFSGGEVFRSGVTFRRGRAEIFYFGPGDQEYPVYYQPVIQRIVANAVRWAAPLRLAADETRRRPPRQPTIHPAAAAPGRPDLPWQARRPVAFRTRGAS